MDFSGMDQLTDMGFTRELAAQALAATGGKSTLKATEWILNHRKPVSDPANPHSNAGPVVVARQQVRVDHFFSATTSKAEAEPPDFPKKSLRIEAPPPKPLKQTPRLTTFQEPPPPAKKLKPDEDAQAHALITNAARPSHADNVEHEQEEQTQANHPLPFMSTKTAKKNPKSTVPLAERMRPGSVDDVVGQDHLLGGRGVLRSLLESDSLPSVIFWGPPGTGKTTLARAIAASVSYRFVALSAVSSGVKEVREILEEAKRVKKYGQRTLLFLDEVHRFNKAQQDAFLPYVEAGSVVFIGATTENPSFEINAALLSRCKVLTLNKLQPGHLRRLIDRAVSDRERGAAVAVPPEMVLRVEDDAANFLAGAADGDARVALNTLEIAVLAAASRCQKACEEVITTAAGTVVSIKRETLEGDRIVKRESFNILEVLKENVQHSQQEYTRPFKKFVGGKNVTAAAALAAAAAAAASTSAAEAEKEVREQAEADKSAVVVSLGDVREALQRSHVFYDKSGEEHYNIISALHKSMRGGDADAAIYWLARMLEGGEGPLYVARRLVRFASEDVGMADPQALPQAVACYQACHYLGVPECNVHLAQCAVYLALAPKSVAVYQAIEAAQKFVREKGQNEPVPLHLRNAPTKLMKELGYAKGYVYPPSHSGPVEQEYMPPSLRGHKFLRWPPPAL